MARPLRSAVGAAALVGALAAAPAQAHPHVWIDVVATFVFEDGALVGVRQEWRFDPIYSSFVVNEHDRDDDGALDEAERRRVVEQAFAGLPEVGHFTHLFVDGEETASDAVAEESVAYADGTLSYRFMLPLREPVDPAAARVKLGTYDEEYYVDLVFDDVDPVRFEGIASGACHFAIEEDAIPPIYFGLVVPPVIGLRCPVS